MNRCNTARPSPASPGLPPTARARSVLGVRFWCCAVVGALLSCSSESPSLEEGPVEFSRLRAEEVGADRAVIRFDTSVETTCELEYGFATDDLPLRAVDPDMDPNDPYSIDHQVPLEDLPSASLIFYRARATTRGGSTFYSEVESFETLAADPAVSSTAAMSNVALISAGARVMEVSSNFGGADNDGAWGVEAAFDGQMGTEWSTNGDGDEAFVVIDLGQARSLQAVAYRSRKMSDGSSIVTSYRLVLDEGQVLGPFVTPDPDERYEVVLDEPITTTSVRFEAVETTGGNTGAKEIELFVDG